MKTDPTSWFGKSASVSSVTEEVDKQSYVPAYVQLAQIIRRGISGGAHPAGSRLPAEAALAKRYGVSPMTARQAVSLMVKEGLVRRVQGSGTYVRKPEVTTGSFSLEAMQNILADQTNLQVRIRKASVVRSSGPVCISLAVEPNVPLIFIERLILYKQEPFTLQTGYARFEPESPVVETMLDTTVLTGLFLEEGLTSFKKGIMRLLPTAFDKHEAQLLNGKPGDYAFKLEHIFYDFNDQPAAFGCFLVSPEKMPLIGRVGVWGE
jgi:DNA-binding GntR family transcriptional regulator